MHGSGVLTGFFFNLDDSALCSNSSLLASVVISFIFFSKEKSLFRVAVHLFVTHYFSGEVVHLVNVRQKRSPFTFDLGP